jgi:hypothetical protein
MFFFPAQSISFTSIPELLLIFGFIFALYFTSWFIGRILKYLIKKLFFLSPDIRNGLLVLVTFAQFSVSLTITFFLLITIQVQPEFIIGSLAILITAIGVAFTGVAANFIGGIYILATRPFHVGDFIKTQGIEGIVQEVGINYSRLITLDRTIVKIPNGNLLNSSLLNYTEKDEEKLSNFMSTGFLSPAKRFVNYRKMIELRLDILNPPISIKAVKERLNRVCEEFTDVFGAKPTYFLGKHEFRQELFLVIRAYDGYTIFNAWPYFMESLTKNIYQELQQEESR